MSDATTSRPKAAARRLAVSAARKAEKVIGYKARSELAFWTDVWDRTIRDGGLWGENTLELSGDDAVAGDYLGRRWQQARAEVRRVLGEAGIEDADFFDGKVVVDIGPGCVGLPDALPAKRAIAVEPLADEYAEAGLLLESEAIYLSVPAERIPLVSGTVDVVIARNSLDHVEKPARVIAEVLRILRPGGDFILNVDLDHPASPTEPHEFSRADVERLLAEFETVRTDTWEHGHAGRDKPGHAIVIHARKRP